MNESILRALMRLFAIVASLDKRYSEQERSIVMDYLDRQYSHEIVRKYIEYFDQQVKSYQTEPGDTATSEANKPFSLEPQITELCNQINAHCSRLSSRFYKKG